MSGKQQATSDQRLWRLSGIAKVLAILSILSIIVFSAALKGIELYQVVNAPTETPLPTDTATPGPTDTPTRFPAPVLTATPTPQPTPIPFPGGTANITEVGHYALENDCYIDVEYAIFADRTDISKVNVRLLQDPGQDSGVNAPIPEVEAYEPFPSIGSYGAWVEFLSSPTPSHDDDSIIAYLYQTGSRSKFKFVFPHRHGDMQAIIDLSAMRIGLYTMNVYCPTWPMTLTATPLSLLAMPLLRSTATPLSLLAMPLSLPTAMPTVSYPVYIRRIGHFDAGNNCGINVDRWDTQRDALRIIAARTDDPDKQLLLFRPTLTMYKLVALEDGEQRLQVYDSHIVREDISDTREGHSAIRWIFGPTNGDTYEITISYLEHDIRAVVDFSTAPSVRYTMTVLCSWWR